MDYKYIEQLLERYWEGETTLQEESILRQRGWLLPPAAVALLAGVFVGRA